MNLNRTLIAVFLPLATLALTACEQLGIDDPVKTAAMAEAEGKAVGSGCRHVGMSLKDCYDKNKKTSKAAIFAGWRDMDAYMRENQIETMDQAEAEAPDAHGAGEAKDGAEVAPAKKATDDGHGAGDKPAAAGKKTVALERLTFA